MHAGGVRGVRGGQGVAAQRGGFVMGERADPPTRRRMHAPGVRTLG
jgi:hypothetical protein